MSLRYNILLALVLLSLSGMAQTPISVPRSPASIVPTDVYLKISRGLSIPVVADTAHGLSGSLDSLGLVIQIRSTGDWYKRDTSAGTHKWTLIGGGGGSPNTSLGGKANIAISGTNNVKTLDTGFATKIDTTVSNVVKVGVDSAKQHTYEPFFSDSTKKFATPKQLHDSIIAQPVDSFRFVNKGAGVTMIYTSNDSGYISTLSKIFGVIPVKLGDSSVGFTIDSAQIATLLALKDTALVMRGLIAAATLNPPNTTAKYLTGYNTYSGLNTDSIAQGTTNKFFVASDTAGLRNKVDSIRRAPGSLNVMEYKGGVADLAYKDSVGTGGGSITGSNGVVVAGGNATLDTNYVDLLQMPILALWRYADTTGVIDATPALNSLIALDSASGFRYVIELGPYQYKIAGPLQSDCNCIIRVPTLNPNSSTKQGVLVIHGSSSTTPLLIGGYGISVFPKPTTGTRLIVSTPATFTNGLYPAVFGADNVGGLGFSYTPVDFKDFSLQLYTNHATIPMRMSGLMLPLTATFNIERVYVTPDTNSQVVPAPDSLTCGMCLSKWNNNGANHLSRTGASGFVFDYFLGEHTTLDLPYAFDAKFGFASGIAGYPISGRVLTHGCKFSLMSASTVTWFGFYTPGATTWDLTVDEEQNAKGFWYDYVGDINDSSNFANGWVHYIPSDSAGKGLIRINGGLHLNVIRGDVQDSITLTAAVKFTGFTGNHIPYFNSSNYITHSAGLTFDAANGRFGAGLSTTPATVGDFGGIAVTGPGMFVIRDLAHANTSMINFMSFYDNSNTRFGVIGFGNYIGGTDPNFYITNQQTSGGFFLRNSSAAILGLSNAGILTLPGYTPGSTQMMTITSTGVVGSQAIPGGSGSPVGGDKATQYDSAGFFSGNVNQFAMNYATNRFGIGTGATPSAPLHINGTSASNYGMLALQDAVNTNPNMVGYIAMLDHAGTRIGLFGIGQYGGTSDENVYFTSEITGNTVFRNHTAEIGRFMNSGNFGIGTATDHAAFLQTAVNTTTNSNAYFPPSAGVDVTTPTNGQLWNNGTNLFIRMGTGNIDLVRTWNLQQAITQGATMAANNNIALAAHSFAFTGGQVLVGSNTDRFITFDVNGGVGQLKDSLLNNTAATTNMLVYDTVSQRYGRAAIPSGGATFANPSGTIGLTANNGTANAAMRSDATPALSQSLTPTMTGKWTFNGGVGLNGVSSIPGTGVLLAQGADSNVHEIGLGNGFSIGGGLLQYAPTTSNRFTQIADATITNTVTTTTLIGTGSGSLSIPSSSLNAGQTITIRGIAYLSTASSAPIVQFLFTNGLFVSNVTPTVAANLTSAPVEYEFTATIQTAGISGNVELDGWVSVNGTKTYMTSATNSFNTTSTQTFNFSINLGTASTSNNIVNKTFRLTIN